MFEAIEYYQSLAEKFDSRILFLPGISIVLTGLCIWLAGLRWRKVLGAFAGGCFLAAIGLCIGDYGWPVMIIVTLIGIALGAIIEKIMLGIVGTVLVAAAVMIIASVFFESNDVAMQSYPRWAEYETRDAEIGLPQAFEITRQTGRYIAYRMIENVKSSWLVYGASAGAAILLAGFAAMMLPRIFIAAFSSSFGSAAIFSGMIMLLFYKGLKPVNYIYDKSSFYALIIFLMIIFGTMVQLVLSPAAKNGKTGPNENGDKK